MENLFFLIVLAIIILSNVASIRKKMKSAGGGSSDTGGWLKSLRGMIDDIKAELEKASGQPSQRPHRPSGWEDLLGAGREMPPEQQEIEKPRARSRMETRTPAHPEIKERPRIEKGRETLLETLQKRGATPDARMAPERKAIPEPDLSGYKSKLPDMPDAPAARPWPTQRRAYSVAELRNAVIWYEILSPPVALREQDGQKWQ